MKHLLRISTTLCLAATLWGQEKLHYPDAARVDQTDAYHGTKVKDPYRWLEEYSEQTTAWIAAENQLTSSYLQSIPQRDKIKTRLTQLWNYEKFGVPRQESGHYFFTRNDGLQNQSVLYTTDSLKETPRVLLDPNTLAKDGTLALAGYSPSDNGKLLAYGLAEAGSDWNTWKVRNVATGEDLPDQVRWVKFSDASWTSDGKGFYYSRFDAPPAGQDLKQVNEFHKIYFHTLGTPQSDDRLAYERKDQPKWYLHGEVTNDNQYLIIDVSPGGKSENGIFYKPLGVSDAPVVELLSKFDAHYQFIDNEGPVLWISSDLEAPRWRVWAIDVRKPEREHWKEFIPQTDDTLEDVSLVGNRFFCSYLKDAKSQVQIYDMQGHNVGQLALPGIGSVSGLEGKRQDTETFYAFTSFTTPPSIYRYDIRAAKSELFKAPKLAFKPSDYTTQQVFFKSKDGTQVPMFISHKEEKASAGERPTLLYGYGGFSISLTPAFSPTVLTWMEMGGNAVTVTLRGGGEYGESWHQAGMKSKKQNVFDDFVSAAEFLVKQKYTSTCKLAIQGGSNGGLLVGAVLNQRPDLFGAALPAVGVMDMLRFQKFTIGWGWVGEYGSSDDPEQFKALAAYSPYHNIRQGVCYPPVLITTADHDDRVYPAHSFKYAAALQAAQSQVPDCTNPILIRIETRAGHGSGKPTSKRIEEAADQLSFLVKNLHVE